MKELGFPKFDYYLDESDPDIVILRRQDGSFVAAFSASGATRDGIDEAAREDYWELVQAHTNVLSRKSQERLSS
jgi:3-oxoacyl-ACP reductase-like protein